MNTRKWCHVEVFVVALFCAIVAATPGAAQDSRLDLKNLEHLASKAAEVVDVTLDGPLLRMAEKFMAADEDSKDSEDKEVLALIRNLKGVYVKSFEFDNPGEYSESDVESIRSQLRAPAWSRIVNVRSRREGDNAEVYLMTDGQSNIKGMAIICAEPKQLTVVNIAGPIDLDKLSKLEGKMGIPHVDLEKDAEKPGGAHEKQK